MYVVLYLILFFHSSNTISEADANLRDYSGRKAKQYLKNSASSKAQRKRILSTYNVNNSYETLSSLVPNAEAHHVVTKSGVRLSISDPIPMDPSSSTA